ncbi:hypothetical protein [Actinoplanes sp. NPDC051851]|uniref:hypothetical protein n=1 Tax=Actinoplanes sp. NPDC051851 TaxID=3154753 RepID=UPI00342CB0A6
MDVPPGPGSPVVPVGSADGEVAVALADGEPEAEAEADAVAEGETDRDGLIVAEVLADGDVLALDSAADGSAYQVIAGSEVGSSSPPPNPPGSVCAAGN